MNVHGTTACWPRFNHRGAVLALRMGTVEPVAGSLSWSHVQLCPQNAGTLDELAAESLRAEFPDVRFRLHANVRVSSPWRPGIGTAATYTDDRDYFAGLVRISQILKTDGYTLHPGSHADGNRSSVRTAVLELEQSLGIPVGVEGMYPDDSRHWLLSEWSDYQWLLEGDINYAIDLSHLNILTKRSRWTDFAFVYELLANPRCIEIHISDNNGIADQHRVVLRMPWWLGCLETALKVNPTALVFSEGNHLRKLASP